MIRINLLPFRAARKKENIRRETSIFLLSFVFITIALFYYNGTLNNKIKTIETDINIIDKELSALRIQINEINRIRRALDILNDKTKIINSLSTNRKRAIALLDSINFLVIEKRMWLTMLQARGDNIHIRGIALDNKTVADFMTRLERSNMYINVNLQTVNQTKVLKYELKNFDITCRKKVQITPQTVADRAKK